MMKGAGIDLLKIEKVMNRQKKYCTFVAGRTVVCKTEGRGPNPDCGELHATNKNYVKLS